MAAPSDTKPTPYQSIIAGGAAGGVESVITYPTEYIKTRQQLACSGGPKLSPIYFLSMSIKEHGLRQLYVGAGAFCVANTSKSAVRFLSFDIAKGMLSNDPNTKKVSPTSNMLAGMVAGTAEGLLVVTPGETLKTKLVDDRAGPKAYHSTTHAIRTILSSEGPAGLYRGVLPVTLKQSANAMVRFTSYNFLLDYLHLVSQSGAVPALAGAVAGIVTVYATMPFDSIKTRMQAIGGHKLYQSTWHCARSVVHAEGVQSLWMGTTPRLVRLSISGAISFSVYEYVIARTKSSLWSGRARISTQAIA